MKQDQDAKQKVELYFYCIRYSWQDSSEAEMLATTQPRPETEDTMLVSQRTAYLEFPAVPSNIAHNNHRVRMLRAAIDRVQSVAFMEVSQLNEQIQKLLCLEAEIPMQGREN